MAAQLGFHRLCLEPAQRHYGFDAICGADSQRDWYLRPVSYRHFDCRWCLPICGAADTSRIRRAHQRLVGKLYRWWRSALHTGHDRGHRALFALGRR